MEPHLAHRLPWQSLADAIKGTRTVENRCNKSTPPTRKQLKSLYHFSRCLHDTLTEFAATDKSSDEEKVELDPRNWEYYRWHPTYVHPGYYNLILEGYLELNLLLTDAETFEPLLFYCERSTDAISEFNCFRVWSHKRQLFDSGDVRPLTPDVRQVMRDHTALLFRCMYSLLPPQGRLDVNLIAEQIGSRFGFK